VKNLEVPFKVEPVYFCYLNEIMPLLLGTILNAEFLGLKHTFLFIFKILFFKVTF